MNSKLREVCGVRPEPVLSYIERPDVDDRFVSGLKTDKQMIVYGASKQGKTSLVTKHLSYADNIVIRVGPKTDIDDIYRSILRQVGVKILTESDKTTESESAVTLGAKVKVLIPLFGGGEAKTEGEIKAGSGTKNTYAEVSFNIIVPQDISELLRRTGSKRTIILDNFHYLADERLRQMALDL